MQSLVVPLKGIGQRCKHVRQARVVKAELRCPPGCEPRLMVVVPSQRLAQHKAAEVDGDAAVAALQANVRVALADERRGVLKGHA